MDLKTYNPQGSHTSSSIGRFVNYTGASREAFEATRAEVFRDFPGAVIVDGSDDWGAPPQHRPQLFCGERREYQSAGKTVVSGLGVEPLAWYRSRPSGCSKSGIVISREQYTRLLVAYRETYGLDLLACLNVYFDQKTTR